MLAITSESMNLFSAPVLYMFPFEGVFQDTIGKKFDVLPAYLFLPVETKFVSKSKSTIRRKRKIYYLHSTYLFNLFTAISIFPFIGLYEVRLVKGGLVPP